MTITGKQQAIMHAGSHFLSVHGLGHGVGGAGAPGGPGGPGGPI